AIFHQFPTLFCLDEGQGQARPRAARNLQDVELSGAPSHVLLRDGASRPCRLLECSPTPVKLFAFHRYPWPLQGAPLFQAEWMVRLHFQSAEGTDFRPEPSTLHILNERYAPLACFGRCGE